MSLPPLNLNVGSFQPNSVYKTLNSYTNSNTNTYPQPSYHIKCLENNKFGDFFETGLGIQGFHLFSIGNQHTERTVTRMQKRISLKQCKACATWFGRERRRLKAGPSYRLLWLLSLSFMAWLSNLRVISSARRHIYTRVWSLLQN